MLKIKESINLKELEKFGYVYKEQLESGARKRYELKNDPDVYVYK